MKTWSPSFQKGSLGKKWGGLGFSQNFKVHRHMQEEPFATNNLTQSYNNCKHWRQKSNAKYARLSRGALTNPFISEYQ